MRKILGSISIFFAVLFLTGTAFSLDILKGTATVGPGISAIGIANGSLAIYTAGDIAGYSGGPSGSTFACTSGSVKAKPDVAIIFAMRGSIDPDQPNDLMVYQIAHGASATAAITDTDLAITTTTCNGAGWVVRGRTIE